MLQISLESTFLFLIHLCFNYYERMKAAFQAHSYAKGNDKYIPQRLPSQLLGEFPTSILLTMKTEIWILLWSRFQIAYINHFLCFDQLY